MRKQVQLRTRDKRGQKVKRLKGQRPWTSRPKPIHPSGRKAIPQFRAEGMWLSARQ